MEFDHLKLQTEERPNPLQRVGLNSIHPSHKHTAMAFTDPYSEMNERNVVKPKWTVTLKSTTLSHIIQRRDSENKGPQPRRKGPCG